MLVNIRMAEAMVAQLVKAPALLAQVMGIIAILSEIGLSWKEGAGKIECTRPWQGVCQSLPGTIG